MPAGATYEPIATSTLSVAGTTISFTSIPSTYTDLRLVIAPTAVTGTVDSYIRINNDSGTTYSQTWLLGTGASAISSRYTSTATPYDTNSASIGTTPWLIIHDFFNYAGATYKTILSTISGDKNGSGVVTRYVKLWSSTSAINRIDYIGSANFAIGTTATLYGIKSA